MIIYSPSLAFLGLWLWEGRLSPVCWVCLCQLDKAILSSPLPVGPSLLYPHRLLECSLPVRSEPSTKGRVCGVQKRDKEGGVLSNQPLSSRYLDTGKTRSPTFPLFLQMWGKSRSHNACSQMGKLRPDKENPTQVTQQVTPDQLPFASTSPSPDLTLKRKERSFPDPCRQVWV